MNRKLFIQMMKNLCFGFMITILTPFLSIYTVTDLTQLSDLRFGFPFKFISQQSWLTPFEENLPLRVHIGLPQENPTKIIIGNLLLSLAVITIVLFLLESLWRSFRNCKDSVKNN